MGVAVKLSNKLVDSARIRAVIFNRSVAGQIEYWSKIGKILEENKDLTYDFVKNVLISLEEVKSGNVEPYKFG